LRRLFFRFGLTFYMRNNYFISYKKTVSIVKLLFYY